VTAPSDQLRRARVADDARDEYDLDDRDERPRTMAGRRAGAKRTLLEVIRQLPHYLRLLGGLLIDRRVSLLDKALVAGAIAYIVSPLDLVPDFVPFLGQVDDVFLLMASIERLVANAGEDVVYDHWRGDPAELDALDVRGVLGAATLFLPGGIRARLVRFVRSRGRRSALVEG
jgi:uncharacterized membrane protein YkvA (DUF1232 family)